MRASKQSMWSLILAIFFKAFLVFMMSQTDINQQKLIW
jgi:hypothetical protein